VTDALYEPPPSHQRKGKGGKWRETYKLNIKSFINNTNNIKNMNNKRNKTKYTKLILSFPELGAGGTGVPPAAARQRQEVPD